VFSLLHWHKDKTQTEGTQNLEFALFAKDFRYQTVQQWAHSSSAPIVFLCDLL